MSEPKNTGRARTKGGSKRYYFWPSEDRQSTERYWSVTTLIDGGVPKPALIPWAAKATALYAIQNIDLLKLHIEQDRDQDGNLPGFKEDGKPIGDGMQDAYKLLTESRFKKVSKAGDIGERVHEAIESYVLDRPAPEWPADIAPYLEQAVAFMRHFEVLIEMTEASVFNRTEKYAGTLDALMIINGQRWLIDFKTGGVWPEAALQMAAYARAEFIGRPDELEEPMPAIDHAAIVDLKPTHYDFRPVQIDDDVYHSFLYAREVFRWQEFIAKKTVDAPVPNLERLAKRFPPESEAVA